MKPIKKLLFMLLLMAPTMPARSGEFAYLTFEMTDGTKISVSVSSLALTVDGTTLTAASQSFVISNLSKMYFTASDETTGIRQLEFKMADEITDVFDLQGKKVSKAQMKKGVYIIKTRQGTCKIVVK